MKLLAFLVCLVATTSTGAAAATSQEKPNIILLFADDLGWGDLASYGHPVSETPNLDKMAQEGLRFLDFYSTSPVCSPSRSSIMTGRYQVRTGIYPGVFDCGSLGGLPLNETTVAASLKKANYNTAIIGKWHLGVGLTQQYLPAYHGFDYYLGIPYSHDMCPCYVCFYPDSPCFDKCRTYNTPCPLFENTTIIQQPADFLKLAERFSDTAVSYIHQMATSEQPFFLYMAFHHTHHPQFASKKFTNTSTRGIFGDALSELDWQVGNIFEAIQEAGISNNTFVFFTADNGPSLVREVRGGNAGLLRCGKGSTFEGGMRVPGIAWWPGKIDPGKKTTELASTLDLFPTILNLANVSIPNDRVIDGIDMAPILFGNGKSNRKSYIYYPQSPSQDFGVFAIRYQNYKAHYWTTGTGLYPDSYPDEMCKASSGTHMHDPPLLYDLNHDTGELNPLDVSVFPYNDIIKEINQIKLEFEKSVVWATSEIDKGSSNAAMPCANPGCNPFPQCCVTSQKSRSSLHSSRVFD